MKSHKKNDEQGRFPNKVILDTSALLYDPLAFNTIKESDIYIPFSVLEEMDTFKRDMGEKGASARKFHRFMDRLRDQKAGSLTQGVRLPSGSCLFVCRDRPSSAGELDLSRPDHSILNTALDIQQKNPSAKVVLTSKDINLRIKADVMGLVARDYDPEPVPDFADLYTGMCCLNVTREQVAYFRENKYLSVGQGESAGGLSLKKPLYPHQYIVLQHGRGGPKALGRYSAKKKQIQSIYQPSEPIWGLYPRNREQSFALDALMNDDIMLVSLLGKAGTGKTLLALAVGLHKVLEENSFQKLLVSRPVFPMGKDMGYLPGDIEQKLNPYMQAIFDSLDLLMGLEKKASRLTRDLIQQGMVNIEPLAYIRGRNIAHQYLIVDEAQNLTPHEVKTILTRAGQGTKVVLTGDGGQIDNPYVDATSNGLAVSVEKFRQAPLSAHVTLKKGERSELAELSANLL